MNIVEIKHNIGDKFYVIKNGKIYELEIVHIYIKITEHDSYISFYNCGHSVLPSTTYLLKDVFFSKEEAGIAWLKEQGLDVGLHVKDWV